MQEAKFYQTNDQLGVTCRLCNHFCKINIGQAGICRVRKNVDGHLFSLVYGQPAALNIDPVEKKPLFHFLPGSKALSLGTCGCNFRCQNCQNWEISQINFPDDSPVVSPEKIIGLALSSGCQSIAYTYNEPTVFAEYALEIMKLARASRLKNIWVSNGYMSPESLKEILPLLDAANVDLKSMDEEFYKNICGASLEPVLKNLIDLKKAGVHLEVTTLIIPQLSDNQEMLEKTAKFIAAELGNDTPWHVTKFFSEVSWKLKETPETSPSIILQAYQIGKNSGLKYVYTGNLDDTDKENTNCPVCGQLLIERLGYDITRYDKNCHCPKCKTKLEIIA